MLHLAIALGYDIVGIRWDPDRGDNLVLFEKSLTLSGRSRRSKDSTPERSYSGRALVSVSRGPASYR